MSVIVRVDLFFKSFSCFDKNAVYTQPLVKVALVCESEIMVHVTSRNVCLRVTGGKLHLIVHAEGIRTKRLCVAELEAGVSGAARKIALASNTGVHIASSLET